MIKEYEELLVTVIKSIKKEYDNEEEVLGFIATNIELLNDLIKGYVRLKLSDEAYKTFKEILEDIE